MRRLDCYIILNLPFNATKREIKKSFRTLSKKYHPDLNHDEDALIKYKLIQEAYKILTNDKFSHDQCVTLNPELTKKFNDLNKLFSETLKKPL